MDPNATLHDLICAALSSDAEAVKDAAHVLAGWLDKGGFAPTLDNMLRCGVLEPYDFDLTDFDI